MASTTGEAQSPSSENDAGERPVRKQLKETSIDSATTSSESRRKRSFDETRADAPGDTADADAETGESRRKRSRESSPQETGNAGMPSVSSPTSNNPPSDSTKEEALEPVDFPDFAWIAQLDAREQALAKRSRELEAAALALEAWERELLQAQARLKQREKWFGESLDKQEEREEEVSAREMAAGARESDLDAREAAVEARERALDVSESGWDSEESTDVDDITHQDTKATTTTTTTTTDTSAMPKKKRSLEQLDEAASKKSDAVIEAAEHPAETKPSEESLGEPEKKRLRDNSEERTTKAEKGFAASAFANTSAASPFASLAAPKPSDNPTTTDSPASTSAFASSSLAAFAGSDKSPFGTLGASTPSVFKSSDSTMSGFASASGGSGFGKLGSGFAGVGGGFTAAGKSGGLTSFASPSAPATFGESKAKPLGAEEPQDNEDENDEDEDEEGTNTFEAEKTDERFFEQTIETGEEEEYTVFSCKAKLFHFSGEWKERGIGTFKLNARESTSHPGKLSARMIMRADGALRVMLNSPLFKGMNFGGPKNECPTSKQILLSSIENGRTVPLLLRVGNEDLAKDLYNHIQKTLDAMSDKDDGTKEKAAESSKDQSDEKKDE